MRFRRYVLVAALGLGPLLTTAAGAAGIVPPRQPPSNVSAVPAYSIVNNKSYQVNGPLPPCWRWSKSGQLVPRATYPTCVKDEILATDRAQSAEGLGPLTLPRNFARLGVPEQLLVLVDLISREPRRGTRGGRVGAARPVRPGRGGGPGDPALASSADYPGATGGFVANWAGALSALDANYDWMYTDGWAGHLTDNYDCTGPNAPGCWGPPATTSSPTPRASRAPTRRGSLVMGGGIRSTREPATDSARSPNFSSGIRRDDPRGSSIPGATPSPRACPASFVFVCRLISTGATDNPKPKSTNTCPDILAILLGSAGPGFLILQESASENACVPIPGSHLLFLDRLRHTFFHASSDVASLNPRSRDSRIANFSGVSDISA